MSKNARPSLFNVLGATGCSLSSNRFAILRGFILWLRFGQVATAAILCLIFFFFIFEHLTRWCRFSYGTNGCRGFQPDPSVVPWSYVWILIAAIASFLQLFLLTLLKLGRLRTFPPPQGIYVTYKGPHAASYGFLLSRTDIPILGLYVIAFVCLSDYIVPTRILRGARSGTGCYISNQYDSYSPVIVQQCILGQHGYWWSMGAMLSYLITSILYAVVFVEASTLRRSAGPTLKSGPIALPVGPRENVAASDDVSLGTHCGSSDPEEQEEEEGRDNQP